MIDIIMIIALALLPGMMDYEISEIEKEIEQIKKFLDRLEPDFLAVEKEKEEHESVVSNTYAAYMTLKEKLDDMETDDPDYDVMRDEYEIARSAWLGATAKEETLRFIYDELRENYDRQKLKLELAEKKLENVLKSKTNTKKNDRIGIRLSSVCETLIENDSNVRKIGYADWSGWVYKTEEVQICPTYAQLAATYDNTNPHISGKFIPGEFDVYREDPKKNHWKYYDQTKNGNPAFGLVIMVDPDAEWEKRSTIIEIQSRAFKTVNVWGGQSKQSSYQNNTITTYSGLFISPKCDLIMTSPNMQMITDALNFAYSGCSESFEVNPNVTRLESTPIVISDFSYYKYVEWLEKALENYKGYMIGK